MKILFVVPYVPNPIRVRPYHFVRTLIALGHTVTLATITTDPRDQASVQALRAIGCEVFAYPLPTWRSLMNCTQAIFTRDPLQSYYCWQPHLTAQVAQLVMGRRAPDAFDIVHVEHLRGARFGQDLLRRMAARSRASARPPIIWDSVDCISYLFQQSAQRSTKRSSRMVARFELPRSRQYESRMVNTFDRVLVTSRQDQQALQQLAQISNENAHITIVPNGVDLAYFAPDPAMQPEPATLVVSGKMSYHANQSMTHFLVQSIMPLVWAANPQVKIYIVGKDPSSDIRALAADPRIEVTGYVDDIRPYLRKATVAVAPLTYGAGIQNKILEAMACATPVVTTLLATAALAAKPGEALLVGEDPAAFAAAVIQLIENPALRARIGQAGRIYVESQHDWQKITKTLIAIYEHEIQRKQASLSNKKGR